MTGDEVSEGQDATETTTKSILNTRPTRRPTTRTPAELPTKVSCGNPVFSFRQA